MSVIVLDPGHGGIDDLKGTFPSGNVGPTGVREKDVTLLLARACKTRLEGDGRTVHLVRDEDKEMSVADRAQFSKEKRADVFLSIHLGGSIDSRRRGTEAFWHVRGEARSERLARVVHAFVSKAIKEVTGVAAPPARARDQIVLHPDLHVSAVTAAAMILPCFLSNAQDEAELKKEAFLALLAGALAAGVREYLS